MAGACHDRARSSLLPCWHSSRSAALLLLALLLRGGLRLLASNLGLRSKTVPPCCYRFLAAALADSFARCSISENSSWKRAPVRADTFRNFSQQRFTHCGGRRQATISMGGTGEPAAAPDGACWCVLRPRIPPPPPQRHFSVRLTAHLLFCSVQVFAAEILHAVLEAALHQLVVQFQAAATPSGAGVWLVPGTRASRPARPARALLPAAPPPAGVAMLLAVTAHLSRTCMCSSWCRNAALCSSGRSPMASSGKLQRAGGAAHWGSRGMRMGATAPSGPCRHPGLTDVRRVADCAGLKHRGGARMAQAACRSTDTPAVPRGSLHGSLLA